LMLIFLNRVFHFASHEWIWILLEDAQACAGTEIDSFAVIDGAGVTGYVSECAATGSFIYWLRFGLSH
jgi:hypothetical protein